MDLQADISWIRSELVKVQDPELIAAFKNLLKSRKSKIVKISDFDLSMDRALQDKENGRTEPHDKIRKQYEKWL